MNDLATLTAQPRRIVIAGQSYDLHPLTVGDFGQIQKWLDDQRPDPFDTINAQIEKGRLTSEGRVPYTMAQQKALYQIAVDQTEKGRVLLGTPEAGALLNSAAGTKELLRLSIAKGRPDFTAAEAEALCNVMTAVDVQRVLAAVNAEEMAPDPKAAAGGTTTESPTPLPIGGASSTS